MMEVPQLSILVVARIIPGLLGAHVTTFPTALTAQGDPLLTPLLQPLLLQLLALVKALGHLIQPLALVKALGHLLQRRLVLLLSYPSRICILPGDMAMAILWVDMGWLTICLVFLCPLT
jgi:hypothetical protein